MATKTNPKWMPENKVPEGYRVCEALNLKKRHAIPYILGAIVCDKKFPYREAGKRILYGLEDELRDLHSDACKSNGLVRKTERGN